MQKYIFFRTFALMNKAEKRFYIFLVIWICVDFLQAIFTEIHADEAYYALYGQFLDWGYYDHPPMVALLTHFSSLIATGNLSIRLLTIFLHGATLWLIWKTIQDKQTSIGDINDFFIIASSLVMFVFYGFITTPDAPLLFFVALFFYLYKHYLQNKSWLNAFLLSVSMTGMLYSKYMAILVIVFTVISNFKLLKDIKLWCAVILTALAFSPHILWQLHNNFPSLKYHLILRNDPFDIIYILEYIPNQLLVFNPICLGLALYFSWKHRKSKDFFEKACVFNITGFIVFFGLMTINGHGEPHWTVAISIPILIILYQNTRELQWKKRISYLILPFSILILIIRIILCTSILPESTGLAHQKEKMQELHEFCGDTPAVFSSSFQNPSLYRFHTNGTSVALSSIYNRQSQFDILQLDKDLQGKDVFLFAQITGSTPINFGGEEFFFTKISHFQGTNRITTAVNKRQIEGDSILLDLTFYNLYNQAFDFYHPECPVHITAYYSSDNQWQTEACKLISNTNVIPPHDSIAAQIKFKLFYDTPMIISLETIASSPINSEVMTFTKAK